MTQLVEKELKTQWFENEEDWILKRSIIFSRDMTRFTFLEVDRVVKLAGPFASQAKVLDLCCGIGRHSIGLAGLGFKVTGVDITKPYLKIAAESAAKANVDVEFVHSDMKDFVRPGYFDLVVNLCTSFGYLETVEDDVQVLRNIHKSLKPGGKFILELQSKEVLAAKIKSREEEDVDGYHVVSLNRIINNWGTLECRRVITKGSETKEIVAYHRLYSATEMEGHLKASGFTEIKFYGSFAGAPYDNHAKSMIVTCNAAK